MKEVKDFTEFYHVLENAGKTPVYNEHVSHFRNMVSGLGGGCGCNRNRRIEQCKNMYLQMCANLTATDKAFLKAFLGVGEVKLAADGNIFCVF